VPRRNHNAGTTRVRGRSGRKRAHKGTGRGRKKPARTERLATPIGSRPISKYAFKVHEGEPDAADQRSEVNATGAKA